MKRPRRFIISAHIALEFLVIANAVEQRAHVLPRIAARTVLSRGVHRVFERDVCVHNLIQGLPE